MTVRDTFRLMLPAGVLVAVGLVVYAVTYWDEPIDRAAKRMTDVAVALQHMASTGPADAVNPILASIAARSGYERVWIVDGSETIAHSSRETEAGTSLEGPWRDFLVAATSPSLFRTAEWGDRLMLFSAYRSADTGMWSAVLKDGTPIRRERWVHLALMAALGLLALTLLGFAMQVAVGRSLLHPMTVLSEHVDGIATGKAAPTAAIERIAGRGGAPLEKIADALRTLWTERDSLRRDLNERHALYLASTFLTGEMIMVATFDGRIAEVNRSFCERLGLDRSRILGRPLASLAGVLPASALREMGERSAREKRPFERLLFTFSPPGRQPIAVVAAVQAVPFAGEPAFMLVAGERRLGDEAAPDMRESSRAASEKSVGAAPEDVGARADDIGASADDAGAFADGAGEAADDAGARRTDAAARADDAGATAADAGIAADDAGVPASDAGRAADAAGTPASDAGRAADDAGTRADDAGRAADDAGTRADDAGRAADDAGTRADDARRAVDDAGATADNAGAPAGYGGRAAGEGSDKSAAAEPLSRQPRGAKPEVEETDDENGGGGDGIEGGGAVRN